MINLCPSFVQVKIDDKILTTLTTRVSFNRKGVIAEYIADISNSQYMKAYTQHQTGWVIGFSQNTRIGGVTEDDLIEYIDPNGNTTFSIRFSSPNASGGAPNFAAGFTLIFSNVIASSESGSISLGSNATYDYIFEASRMTKG